MTSRWAPYAIGAALLGFAVFVFFFRLGTASWNVDELTYRAAGLQYAGGSFGSNLEHPLLGKYILGAFQEAFGSSALSVRFPAAVAGLLTGMVLFLFARRVAGLYAGLAASLLWVLMPHGVSMGGAELLGLKIERFAMLDVFMNLFVACALYAGWRWSEEGSWRWAAVAGVAAGLAAASKAPGILVLPSLLLVGLAGRLERRRVLQGLAVVGAAAAAALLTYVPLGTGAPDAISEMFRFQELRVGLGGQPIEVAGRVYSFQPWWTHLWFERESLGWVAALALAAGGLTGLFVLPRTLALYLASAVLIPFLFLSFVFRVKLPHYFTDWLPALTLLVALALVELARRGRPQRVAAAAIAVPLLVAGIGMVADLIRLRPGDYAEVAARARGVGADSRTLLVLGHQPVVRAHLPRAAVLAGPGLVADAIVIDRSVARRGGDRRILGYLAAHRDEFAAERVDRLMLYVRRPPALGAGETYPAEGATAVPTSTLVAAGHARRGTLTLRRASDRRPVPGTPYRLGGDAVFRPSTQLASGTRYEARLGAGRRWSFTTARPRRATPAGEPALARRDGKTFVAAERGGPRPTVDWTATFTGVPRTSSGLVLESVASSAEGCYSDLYLWQWGKRRWLQLDRKLVLSRPGVQRAVPVVGDASDYTRRGRVRARVRCTRGPGAFALVTDSLTLSYQGR